jgi:hypothetical protein
MAVAFGCKIGSRITGFHHQQVAEKEITASPIQPFCTLAAGDSTVSVAAGHSCRIETWHADTSNCAGAALLVAASISSAALT